MPTYYLYIITRFFESLACESVSFNIFLCQKKHGDSPFVTIGILPNRFSSSYGLILLISAINILNSRTEKKEKLPFLCEN